MNQDKFFSQLRRTFKKKQRGGFIPKNELETFENWVIGAYADVPIAKVTMKVDQDSSPFVFSAPALSHQLELYRLAHENTKKHVAIAVDSRRLNKLPTKEMIAPLRLMGSPFAILPMTLNDYQMRRLAHFEGLFGYASAYIVREAWGKSLCPLPKIDNKLKPLMNAWSERWFRIFRLCVNCRDFLSEPEQKKILKSWDWLDAIAQEHRKSYILYITSDEAEKKRDKGAVVADERRFADMLEDYSNPVDPSSEPSLHRLLEISLSVAEKADVFRDDYLRHYITSVRNWAAVLDGSPDATAVWSAKGKTKRENRGKKG